MESDCPEPDIKQECAIPDLTASKLYRRGLTPRNVSPEKKSTNIYVKCQQKNNVERALHHFMNTKTATSPSEIDMNVTEYADDKVETYAKYSGQEIERPKFVSW